MGAPIEPDGAHRVVRALEAHGIAMLDAPVSGGPSVAEALGIELPASSAAAKVLTELQNRGCARNDTAAEFTVLADPR